jgi:hypothetical protein
MNYTKESSGHCRGFFYASWMNNSSPNCFTGKDFNGSFAGGVMT